MPQLVIGHVDHFSARVWVRADYSCTCTIRLSSPADSNQPSKEVALSASTDYTGVAEFTTLRAGQEYTATAAFGDGETVSGRVCTLAEQPPDAPYSFSFVLCSCNLSTASIYNLIALVLAGAGTSLALTSLELPHPRWHWPRAAFVLAPLLKLSLKLVAGMTYKATELKQPPAPYLRSPFLKLAAAFESQLADVEAADRPFPTVGDILVSGNARGIIASSRCEVTPPTHLWRVTLTKVTGTFAVGDDVTFESSASPDGKTGPQRAGRAKRVWPAAEKEPPVMDVEVPDGWFPRRGDRAVAGEARATVVACRSMSLWRIAVAPSTTTFGKGQEVHFRRATASKGKPDLHELAIVTRVERMAADAPQLLEIELPDGPFPSEGDRFACGDAVGVVGSASRVSLWRLALTHVTGQFQAGQEIEFTRAAASDGHARPQRLGPVKRIARARPWYVPPAFFIHAGDQIYYDFPDERRPPDEAAYRRAYREAWFDDESTRRVLSQWPHYMTMDDHELADQFARDFHPPVPGLTADDYRERATRAYDDYVRPRSPASPPRSDRSSPYWFAFDKGQTRFFVLDTRSERFNDEGRIIGDEQMAALLAWLDKYPKDLKFVVTSVPFVAEVDESRKVKRWYSDTQRVNGDPAAGAAKPRNSANDKWNAPAFRAQREQVIQHVGAKQIERLVFLAGDMHCCYHATMRVGTGSKYEAVTIHEIAGGPVNQLQLGTDVQFYARRAGVIDPNTDDELRYEVVLEQFHTDACAVMYVRVAYVDRHRITAGTRAFVPEVEWHVVRTLTDNTALAWEAVADSKDVAPGGGEAVMSGRMTFPEVRSVSDLSAAAEPRVPGAANAHAG